MATMENGTGYTGSSASFFMAISELARGRTQDSLAEELGVRQQSISKIKNGKRWGHLRKAKAA